MTGSVPAGDPRILDLLTAAGEVRLPSADHPGVGGGVPAAPGRRVRSGRGRGVMEPYWSDETCALYLGDCREVLPALGVTADCVVADPPYGETSLEWDRWPDGWLEGAAGISQSMWCFGSLRMFGEHWAEFRKSGWAYSHDIVWKKNTGAGRRADRFRLVHDQAAHWYRGRWRDIYHEAPRVAADPRQVARNGSAVRTSRGGAHHAGTRGTWVDDGTRIMQSVISARSLRGQAIHPTQKPEDLLAPLITYACPPGGLVVDLFAGSGSTLDAARLSGRRAIGIELYEPYAERAARRLCQGDLFELDADVIRPGR